MANNWQIGQVVRLKSGSPIMTVSIIDGNDVWCLWFDGTKQLEGKFPAETLELYEKF